MKSPHAGSDGEAAWIATIDRLVGAADPGELWIGDDAAVLRAPSAAALLFAADALVEGVHFERSLSSASDIGWKAMAVNLSDIAAMGGTPRAAVVSLTAAGSIDLEALYGGLLSVARAAGCAVVGGDCSSGPTFSISIAVLGTAEPPAPVRRDGAQVGDVLYVTGPLGASAAGLRELRADPSATSANVDAHRRPIARLDEGRAAANAGAHSMMDVSDGLGLDLSRLAQASKVGVRVDHVPVVPGATVDEALGGGEDYALIFSAPDPAAVAAGFEAAGLSAPIAIGSVCPASDGLSFEGQPLDATGYEHS